MPLGHADDQPGLGEVAPPVHLLDEEPQHLLGRVEVGDHAVLERPDRGDVVRGAADHPLGLVADRQDLAGARVQRDDARLVEQDALAAHVDERVGGPEVDGHVATDEAVRHRCSATPSHLCQGKRKQRGADIPGGHAAPGPRLVRLGVRHGALPIGRGRGTGSAEVGEPERDLALGRLRRVRAVDEVLAVGQRVVAADGAGAALRPSVAPLMPRTTSTASSPSRTSATSGPEVTKSRSGG